jgi:hypothetical protein
LTGQVDALIYGDGRLGHLESVYKQSSMQAITVIRERRGGMERLMLRVMAIFRAQPNLRGMKKIGKPVHYQKIFAWF